MWIQHLFIFVIFAAALGYLAYRLWGHFTDEHPGCSKTCACAADIDFDKIAREIEQQGKRKEKTDART